MRKKRSVKKSDISSRGKSSVLLLGKRSHEKSTQVDDEDNGIFKDIGVLEPEFSFDDLMNLYPENSTLQRCVDITASAIVKNGYSIIPDNAGEKIPEEVSNFFEQGNPNSPFELEIQDTAKDLLCTGSSALEISRFLGSSEGVPSGFFRAPIKKMRVVRGRERDKKYGSFRTGQRFVEIDETFKTKKRAVWYNSYTPNKEDREEKKGYAKSPPKGSKQKRMNEIMWFKLSNPQSKYYGQSPAVSLARSLLMAKYTEEFNIDQFEHGWLQKFLFVVKNSVISDDQMLELEEYVEEVLHESKKWSKVPIINLQGDDPLFEVKFLNQHQPEGAYLNLMKFLREQVYMAYGVPPILLNLVDNANRANSREQREVFYQDQVRPMQMLFAYRFTKMIREDFGFKAKFVFNKPDLTEMKEDSEIVKDMIARGVITINEGREMLGLSKVNIAYADVHLIFMPNSVFPIDEIDPSQILESKPAQSPSDEDDDKSGEDEESPEED